MKEFYQKESEICIKCFCFLWIRVLGRKSKVCILYPSKIIVLFYKLSSFTCKPICFSLTSFYNYQEPMKRSYSISKTVIPPPTILIMIIKLRLNHILWYNESRSLTILDFPWGSAGKEFACNAGDLGLIPGLGKSPGKGKGYPLQYSGLENSVDCIFHGVAKSQT